MLYSGLATPATLAYEYLEKSVCWCTVQEMFELLVRVIDEDHPWQ